MTFLIIVTKTLDTMFTVLFVSFLFSVIDATPLVKDNRTHQQVDPDAFRNVSQLIQSKGYLFEEHLVQTTDGYILGLHRIPPKQAPSDNRPVVLLQHGLLSCSSCWVENLANQSLGFILSDANMDVWLGNNRGNTYSKRHIKYKSSDQQYWQFTWDEMAKYDLPATVDYILKATNATQIYYVGHSQGTEIIFAELGRNADLASKIKHVFALAPVAEVGNIGGPFKTISPLAKDLFVLFSLLGKGEFLPKSKFISLLGRDFCGNSQGGIICENVLFFIAGHDSKELNQTRIPVYVAEHPAGTSIRNLVHYTQAVMSGQFQMYDHGSATANMDHYNQTTPPLYDVSQMKNNVTLYSGGNDILADPIDVQSLLNQLPNVYRHVNISYYEHLDFIWAMDAASTCYSDIVATIKLFENQ